jgi:hypothetical protein
LSDIFNFKSLADGEWSNWSEWSTCTLECGSGNQTRTRTCTNPEPQFNGVDCGEGGSETQACNKDPCPIGNLISNGKIKF